MPTPGRAHMEWGPGRISDLRRLQPPALVMPGPEPQGLVSQHIRGWRRWDGRDGGLENLSCRRRTGQRGRHDVPAAPADAGAYHAGTGPILMGRC